MSHAVTPWQVSHERDGERAHAHFKSKLAAVEVSPRDLEDWKLVSAHLAERPTLRAEGKQASYRDSQATVFEEG